MDKVSIIVPVYNVEDCLSYCVDSLRQQTYKNIEIILVDDGSTDRSGEICDQHAQEDERVRVLHIENGGISNARNTGVKEASTDWIIFIRWIYFSIISIYSWRLYYWGCMCISY